MVVEPFRGRWTPSTVKSAVRRVRWVSEQAGAASADLPIRVPRRPRRQRAERSRGPGRRVPVPLRPGDRRPRLQGHLLRRRVRGARAERRPEPADRLPGQHRSAPAVLRPRDRSRRPTGSRPCGSRSRTPRSRAAPTSSGSTTPSSSPSIGEHLWKFDVNRLTKAEQVAPHGLKIPHAMKRTASGRYIVYGGMDHPTSGEASEVGVLDTGHRGGRAGSRCRPPAGTSSATRCSTSSTRSRSGSTPPTAPTGEHWGMAWLRQYAFEIDAEDGQVLRHWAADRDLPAHINSDVTHLRLRAHLLHRWQPHRGPRRPADAEPAPADRRAPRRAGEPAPLTAPVGADAWPTSVLARQLLQQRRAARRGAAGQPRRARRRHLRLPALGRPDACSSPPTAGRTTSPSTTTRRSRSATASSCPSSRSSTRGWPPWGDPRLGFHHSYLVSPDAPRPTPSPAGAR